MVETGSAALDAIEILVDFVRAVKGHVDEGVFGQRVEFDVFELGLDDHLAGLVPGGNEVDLRDAVVLQGLDGFDDVDDGAAGPDAHVLGRGVEVVRHGAAGGVAFGRFDVGHGEGSGGEWGGSEGLACGIKKGGCGIAGAMASNSHTSLWER